MKEKCPNCGNEIYQNSKYCGNCGKELTKKDNEDLEKTIVMSSNQISTINENSKTNNNSNQYDENNYKSIGTVSLVFGILSIFLGFICSIIGIITGAIYTNKSKKTSAGLIISIITLILRLILIILLILLIVAAGPYEISSQEEQGYTDNYYNNNNYNYNNEEYYDYNNNYDYDSDSQDKLVGTPEFGYVKVPNDWIRFFDPDAPQTFQYSYKALYIITLYAYDSSINDPYSVANNLKLAKEKEGYNISMTQTTIDKYRAYMLEYQISGTWINVYFFKADDNKVHYMSIEGPDKNSTYFNIPKTYRLTNKEV